MMGFRVLKEVFLFGLLIGSFSSVAQVDSLRDGGRPLLGYKVPQNLGEIKKATPPVSAFDEFLKESNYWTWKNSIYFSVFNGVKSKAGETGSAIVWTPASKYQPQTFYLLSKVPDDVAIDYHPVDFQKQNLANYQRVISGRDLQANASLANSRVGVKSLMQTVAVTYPDMVKYTWSEVPEPGKSIRDGRQMRTKDLEKDMFNKYVRDVEAKSTLERTKKKFTPWDISGAENLQLSQAYLSNWVKGGESSVNLSSDLRVKAIYKKDKHEWESSGIHKIGILTSGETGRRLSDDIIELYSKYGHKAANKWYYSFLTTFKTQFFYGYARNDTEKKNPLSGFLSPAYMQFIAGMDYKRDGLSILLSPISSIVTLVNDTAKIDQTRFKIPDNKKSNTINGFSITTNWKYKITREISYSTRMELFYEYKSKDGQKRLDWENILDMRVNRFLSTRVLLQMRYFDNESEKFQIRENINIAFKYAF